MKEYVVVVFVRVCVFSKVLEQLCAPSTSNEVSKRCENLEVEALESFEPSKKVSCLASRFSSFSLSIVIEM